MVKLLTNAQALLTILCATFLLLSLFPIHPAMPYLSVAFGSYFALKAAFDAIKERQLDVNFLMVFAAVGAVVVGYPIDAAALLFLFSLSGTLESYAMAKTRSAIAGLMKLRPDTAIRVLDGKDTRVPIRELRAGDSVRVLPFEQIPTDAEILTGVGEVNQAAMTGESVPVSKMPGDKVLGGTQNLDAMLVLKVTHEIGGSALDKIVLLVQEAQDNKASGEKISAWFGQTYTFVVIAAFFVSLVIRKAIGITTSDALYESLTLLVALSPCALVISTPASTLSALSWAAKNGMLVRGGEFIELAATVNTIAIDKTGTLTTGRPELVEICVCSTAGIGTCKDEEYCWNGHGPMSPEATEMLQAAAGAEQYSTHPIADAIVKAARVRNIVVPEAEEQRAHSGLGVTAVLGGKAVKIGQRRFFESLPEEFLVHAAELTNQGMTVVILEYDNKYAALGVRDELRPGADMVLQQLTDLGIKRIAMLTGDTSETAQAIAEEAGIVEFHAGLLPDQKTEIIDKMVGEGASVLMVGDGINDAPSLAKATVGMAMGGLGSDIALNAADVVLMQDRLEKIPELIRLGRLSVRIIRSNLFFAVGVIGGLTVCSLFFRLPLPLAVIGHEGSTVLVILNGLRLLHGPGTSAIRKANG